MNIQKIQIKSCCISGYEIYIYGNFDSCQVLKCVLNVFQECPQCVRVEKHDGKIRHVFSLVGHVSGE